MADFTWESTTDEVLAGVDLQGKRALVTGVSSGLGVETSRALLAHGAEVIGARAGVTTLVAGPTSGTTAGAATSVS